MSEFESKLHVCFIFYIILYNIWQVCKFKSGKVRTFFFKNIYYKDKGKGCIRIILLLVVYINFMNKQISRRILTYSYFTSCVMYDKHPMRNQQNEQNKPSLPINRLQVPSVFQFICQQVQTTSWRWCHSRVNENSFIKALNHDWKKDGIREMIFFLWLHSSVQARVKMVLKVIEENILAAFCKKNPLPQNK